MTTLCSIAALRNYTGPDEIVRVLGYHSLHDGGGGTFVWRLKCRLPAGAAADNGILFASANITGTIARDNGLWERLDQEGLSVKWFGARGDGRTDDTLSLQAALDSGAPRIYLPYTSGGYRTTGIVLPGGTSLIGLPGHGKHTGRKPIFKIAPGRNHYAIKTSEYCVFGSLENVAIEGIPGIAFGLSVSAGNFRTVDVSVYGFTDAPGLVIDRSGRSVHSRLQIYGCTRGLQFMGESSPGSAVIFNSLQHTIRAYGTSPSLSAVRKGLWQPSPSYPDNRKTYPRRAARYMADKTISKDG